MEHEKEQFDRKTVDNLMQAFIRFHRNKMGSPNPSLERKRSEARALVILSDAPEDQGLMVYELSKKMRVTSPFVTQLLKNLEESKLVKRQMDPKDRRFVRISLTVEGKRVACDVKKKFYERFLTLTQYLGEEDSRQLSKLLHKAFDFMDEQEKKIYEEGDRK